MSLSETYVTVLLDDTHLYSVKLLVNIVLNQMRYADIINFSYDNSKSSKVFQRSHYLMTCLKSLCHLQTFLLHNVDPPYASVDILNSDSWFWTVENRRACK